MYMYTLFTIVFWLQVRPPPGFQPLPVKQEPVDEDPPEAIPMSEPAVTGGTQGGGWPLVAPTPSRRSQTNQATGCPLLPLG